MLGVLLVLLERPLVETVQLCRVRLGEMIQMVPLVLLLLLLFQVLVRPQMLARLGCNVLGMPLGQVQYAWLVLLLMLGSLRSTVAVSWPEDGAHEGVTGKQGAYTVRVDPGHDG